LVGMEGEIALPTSLRSPRLTHAPKRPDLFGSSPA